MPELTPAPFAELVTRLYAETRALDSVFALPRKKWYVPSGAEPDLSVAFHHRRAGNAAGPAAGPHTQMAQNLLLAYVAGGRVLELKTVQVNDRLAIPRPCIDITNIGFNVEWSQELQVHQSLREYVAGSMLIEMFRRDARFVGDALAGPAGEVIYDLSVGYDLKGIESDKVQRFLDGLADAGAIIEDLREEIPREFAVARELPYAPLISDTVTLSTFHGCPADEIERICEFLIAQRGLDVIVKMNPPMLGRERLEHLLYDVMGYRELSVVPAAYTSGLQFADALGLVDRLTRFAQARGRRLGCKFSNTLEVTNHKTFFTSDNKVQYLSGQPLHVITMALAAEFRRAVGPAVPFSFSAGIDNKNFAPTVAAGFVPASVCTDLLRPGGYGRMPPYLAALAQAMRAVGAGNVDQYILDAFGHRVAAEAKAAANPGTSAVQWAAAMNLEVAAKRAEDDPRYRAPDNRAVPKRIDSRLETFDCITCDKCIPVCPNAANFTYPTPKVAFDTQDVIVSASGQMRLVPGRRFEIDRTMQIANHADFCNECGNCDTFCPEYGGPYIQKPAFYGSVASYNHGNPRDGFVVLQAATGLAIRGRMKGREHELVEDGSGMWRYRDGVVELLVAAADHRVISARALHGLAGEHTVEMTGYHTLRFLLAGVMDAKYANSINAAIGSPPAGRGAQGAHV